MHLVTISVLVLLLIVASWQDYCGYHIRNALVLFGTLLGFLLNFFLTIEIGVTDSSIGCVLGLLLLLPLYLLRTMGAGDVKLMAMVGAFVGPNDILAVFLCTLVAGSVLALIVALQRGVLRKLIDNFTHMFLLAVSANKPKSMKENILVSSRISSSVGKLPYGIAIAAGTIIFLAISHSELMIK